MASEQFSLCWDNFHKNMSSGMNSLLENEDLVDVTLAVEGKYLKAHKMVLSVCSPYFRELFKVNPCKHPIVFMKDVSYVAMSDLLQFMYQGEVQVSQENLTTFIKTAEALQIKGLTGDGNGSAECDNDQDEPKPTDVELPKPTPRPMKKVHQVPTPPAKRPRLSAPEPSVPPAVTKTEPAAVSSASNNDQLIQFKMEPYDQGQSTVTIPDDNADETFTDDPLDETNADDGNEDYSMMEGGDEEPQAGTSADGTAGEGQGFLGHATIKIEEDKTELVDESFHNLMQNIPTSVEQIQRSNEMAKTAAALKKVRQENSKLRDQLRQDFCNQYDIEHIPLFDEMTYQMEGDNSQLPAGLRREKEIHLGQGIFLPVQMYDHIVSQSKTGQQFVRSMAVVMFGTDALARCSVTGTISRRTKTVKPQLDPTKLRAMKDIYRHYLLSKNAPVEEIESELEKTQLYIGRKIADICRKPRIRRLDQMTLQ